MPIRYMSSWVGNSSLIVRLAVFVILLMSGPLAMADDDALSSGGREPQAEGMSYSQLWSEQEGFLLKTKDQEKLEGVSYIISGSIGLLGGLAGTSVTADPLEKGIYAVFQSIGIASIGYGAFKWQVGDEQRLVLESLRTSGELSPQDKMKFLNHYRREKKALEKKERFIKAVTHGLIAALNFYNLTLQTQDGVKSTLTFIGTANLLACLSYSF